MPDFKEEIVSTETIRKRTLIAFSFFFLFIIACIVGWKWLHRQPNDEGALKPLRAVLNANEKIFSSIISDNHLAKTFPVSAAEHKVRVNGDAGMSAGFDPAAWKLKIVRKPGDTLFVTLDEIKALPKTEIIFDFKCIEGWSQVTHWGGVRFSDFVEHYGLTDQSQMLYA